MAKMVKPFEIETAQTPISGPARVRLVLVSNGKRPARLKPGTVLLAGDLEPGVNCEELEKTIAAGQVQVRRA